MRRQNPHLSLSPSLSQTTQELMSSLDDPPKKMRQIADLMETHDEKRPTQNHSIIGHKNSYQERDGSKFIHSREEKGGIFSLRMLTEKVRAGLFPFLSKERERRRERGGGEGMGQQQDPDFVFNWNLRLFRLTSFLKISFNPLPSFLLPISSRSRMGFRFQPRDLTKLPLKLSPRTHLRQLRDDKKVKNGN